MRRRNAQASIAWRRLGKASLFGHCIVVSPFFDFPTVLLFSSSKRCRSSNELTSGRVWANKGDGDQACEELGHFGYPTRNDNVQGSDQSSRHMGFSRFQGPYECQGEVVDHGDRNAQVGFVPAIVPKAFERMQLVKSQLASQAPSAKLWSETQDTEPPKHFPQVCCQARWLSPNDRTDPCVAGCKGSWLQRTLEIEDGECSFLSIGLKRVGQSINNTQKGLIHKVFTFVSPFGKASPTKESHAPFFKGILSHLMGNRQGHPGQFIRWCLMI